MTEPAQQTEERRQYAHPPIREALCEFRFDPEPQTLDLTLPGRLVERLRDEYAGPTQALASVQAAIRQGGGENEATFRLEGTPGRVRMMSADGSRGITVGPGLLTVHVLHPYPGWETFRSLIEDAFTQYVDVTQADTVSRITIRYINDVRIPESHFETTDYFNISLNVGDGLPDMFTSTKNHVIYLEEDGTLLGLQFESQPIEDPEASMFLLDLDVQRPYDEEGLQPHLAMAHVDELRASERRYFEALITDDARELFDED